MNHIDIIEARSRNIAIGHTTEVLTDSVAEINVALVLSSLRGVVSAVNSVINVDWEKQNMRVKNLFGGLGESLVGKTVGFLGLGRIGLATAKRLLPFKIGSVYYCNRQESPLAKEVN